MVLSVTVSHQHGYHFASGGILQNGFQTVAAGIFQAGGHDGHAIQEQANAAQQVKYFIYGHNNTPGVHLCVCSIHPPPVIDNSGNLQKTRESFLFLYSQFPTRGRDELVLDFSLFACYNIETFGDVPKRLKGADSKSARRRKTCGGSNPSISARKRL